MPLRLKKQMKKAEKTFFVENLAQELKEAKSVVLINYAGLSVKSQQELKKRLKEVGAKLVVVKNTLLKLAGEKAQIEKKTLEEAVLTGQTALVIGTMDPLSPIQVLGKFAKEFETPKFKVGLIEESFQDEAGLNKLSSLPGRDILLGQLLGALMALQYGLVGTLKGNIQKLVFILNEKAKVS
jgi:large subunit ribosomal protein L10